MLSLPFPVVLSLPFPVVLSQDEASLTFNWMGSPLVRPFASLRVTKGGKVLRFAQGDPLCVILRGVSPKGSEEVLRLRLRTTEGGLRTTEGGLRMIEGGLRVTRKEEVAILEDLPPKFRYYL